MGVDGEYCSQWDRYVVWYFVKVCVEVYFVVCQFEIVYCMWGNIENDLFIVCVFYWYEYVWQCYIYYQVWCQLVIQQLVIKCL